MANKIDYSGGRNRIQPEGASEAKNVWFPYTRTYANATQRTTDATLTAEDVNALALQTNEGSIWLLTSAGPPLVWAEVPVAYVAPTFSAFAISGQTTPLEVGDAIATARTFTWTTTSPGNVEANSIDLDDVTLSANIASGLADDSSEATAYPAAPIQKTSAATNVFRITGETTRGASFTRDYTVTWRWRFYYGESASAGPLSEANIEALRANALLAGYAGTYAFSAASGQYKYLCYPAALGTATTFKDASTNLDVPFEAAYTVSVTNTFGITTNYNVHRTTNAIGGAINIIVS